MRLLLNLFDRTVARINSPRDAEESELLKRLDVCGLLDEPRLLADLEKRGRGGVLSRALARRLAERFWNVPLVAPVEVGEKRKNISTCSHCTSLGLFTPTRIHDKRTCPLNPAAGVQATPRARPVPYANAGAPVRADNAPGFRGKRIRVGC